MNRKKSESSDSRLCELPNEVIHNILGLLPIKEAVRSCVLGRRWKQLWRSMPCLIFRRSDIKNNIRMSSRSLVELVHKVCALRDPSYPIQRFKLEDKSYYYDEPYYNNDVMKDCIEKAVVDGGVQDLFISTWSVPLPICCIFSSQTLVQCHLSFIIIATLELPDRISLPKLKVLHLRGIKFSDLKSFQQLCYSPLLEELDVKDCKWMLSDDKPTNVVSISAPNLKRLTLHYYTECTMPSPIRMHCVSLKEFNYTGIPSNELHISGMKHLDQAKLDWFGCIVNNNSFKLLNCVSSTKRLTLRTFFLKGLHGLPRQLLEELTQFDNLIKLTLHGRMALSHNLHTILRKFPYLQVLRLEYTWEPIYSAEYVTTDPIPLHHLKKMEVTCDNLIYINMNLVALLLMSSPVLEEMVLMIRNNYEEDDRVVEKLRRLPKVSKDCRISHLYL